MESEFFICQNERIQRAGFEQDHPLVLCIRCLRFVNRWRFGLSIYDKNLKICSRCCNEEKYMQDRDWIEDLAKMRADEVYLNYAVPKQDGKGEEHE